MKKSLSQFHFAIRTVALILLIAGCRKEEAKTGFPPEIHNIYYLENRTDPKAAVNYSEWILIKGAHLKTTKEVIFNTISAPDSLIYADDTSITVKIPVTLPDPANNPITVNTAFGSVTHAFRILQPAPLFTSFTPAAGEAGDIVTLHGNYFDGVESVRFGDQDAEIVSGSKTELKVKVPERFQFGKVTITTPSGEATSTKVFGFQYLLMGDELTAGWWSGPWGGTQAVTTEKARRGTSSVKYTATGTWGGAKWGKNAPDLSMNGYSGFKFSILGGAGTTGKKVKIYFNGVTDKGYELLLNEDAWQDIQIPLINLGSPAAINTLTVQEFSGNKSDFYMDDIGFY